MSMFSILNCPIANLRLDVMMFVLSRMDVKTNVFKGSYDDIAKGTGASYATVADVMQKMQEKNLVSPIGKGEWQVSKRFASYENKNDGALEFRVLRPV